MKISRTTAFILLIITSFLWGIAGPIIKHTLEFYPPLIFLTYRFFLSSIPGIIFFSLYPKLLPKNTFEVKHTLMHSLFVIVLGLSLLFFGFEYTDSLTGNLLAATGPIFSITLGALLLREHITKHELFGMGLAIIGSLITVLTADGKQALGFLGLAMIGNGLILTSRIFNAIGEVSAKQGLKRGISPSALTHIGFIIGFFVLVSISVWQYNGISQVISIILHAPLSAHLGVFYMAFLSGTLGYSLMNIALTKIDLGEASIFTYLTVVFGAPVSIFWLKEPLTPQFLLGASIIAVGVTIAEYKRRKKKKLLLSKKRVRR